MEVATDREDSDMDDGAHGEDLEPRIRRLEALEAIRQLAARHALATDSRDLDALVALYVEDVITPDGRVGRGALRDWFDTELRKFGTTFHLLGSHVIDLLDEDHAQGSVHVRAEYEIEDLWVVAALLHRDSYERRGGRWFLAERESRAFYAADLQDHPLRVPGRLRFPGRPPTDRAELPEQFETWQRFWARRPGVGQPGGAA